MPSGCGERTEQLFDASNVLHNARIGAIGEVIADNSCVLSDYIPVLPNKSYSKNTDFSYSNALAEFDENKVFIKRYISGNGTIATSETTRFIRVSCAKTLVESFMFNSGDTVLPYEPYGYKLPLISAGQDVDIYLGEVKTTRRIKKLVLTGEERLEFGNGCFILWLYTVHYPEPQQKLIYCTHYKGRTPTYRGALANGACMITINQSQIAIKDLSYATVADFKAYLAAQYAAGTPVTIWYVLKEPETAVVNEPLMKIGDYADEISKTGTSMDISTASGSNTLTVSTAVQPSEMTIESISQWIKQN